MVRELSFFDKVAFFLNLIIGVLLLLSCLAPYISVKTFLPLSFLSLLVPFLFIINLPFIIYWFFKKKRILFLSLSAVLLTYFTFGSFYRFGSSNQTPEHEDLRVMTYNCRNFQFTGRIKGELTGHKIIDFVNEKDPDIVCFQEFNRQATKLLPGYAFHYITPYWSGKVVQAILSKYPIIASGSVDFPETGNNAIYADIEYKGDTIRVYNLHLQSFNVAPARVKSLSRAFRAYGKMKKTFLKQEEQADIFDQHRNNSPYRFLIGGDLNNTAFSNVYHITKGEMQDTFEERGLGFGKTFDINVIPFRIDYILVDQSMDVLTHEYFDLKLSDHYPVLTSIRLQ
ncbi:endonuclease/exonuclease/phosphatase family protein [uncultured Eudoraea sp.]|uniref:endonuclease/exonuclease/phosphatase family protein n=1 Tax=uncultured Eudoraea sp. TaxID=1035614 RepID=UPI0026331AC1|nr:endonuclease/exonuclease/phosphatase family protein [uncultured Eudoraea sp.]